MAYDQPNFDLGFDLSMDTSDDQPNFDLGIDAWLNSDDDTDEMKTNAAEYKANFDLGVDHWFDLSSDEQSDDDYDINHEGFGYPLYTLENTRERHIAKFNVTGSEYRLSIPALDKQYTYNEAVQLLHRILRGKHAISFYSDKYPNI
jgi:hypothetical protein